MEVGLHSQGRGRRSKSGPMPTSERQSQGWLFQSPGPTGRRPYVFGAADIANRRDRLRRIIRLFGGMGVDGLGRLNAWLSRPPAEKTAPKDDAEVHLEIKTDQKMMLRLIWESKRTKR